VCLGLLLHVSLWFGGGVVFGYLVLDVGLLLRMDVLVMVLLLGWVVLLVLDLLRERVAVLGGLGLLFGSLGSGL
jgi:hypothetical protein